MKTFETKDDGNNTHFISGAIRSNNDGRGRFDLISPHGLLRLALVYERGAKQKGDKNWEGGFPVSRGINSAIRHMNQFISGDDTEDHLAQAVWQLFAIMHFEETFSGCNEILDLPRYHLPPNADKEAITKCDTKIVTPHVKLFKPERTDK